MKEQKKKKNTFSCEGCDAQCCRYIATQIDTPDCKQDYDHIRWYLLHEGVSVFTDHDGDWYLEFAGKCEALGDDNRCLNYKDRPRICREHGEDGLADCEYHGADSPYELRFESCRKFEQYLDEQGTKWRWKKKRKS